MILHVLVQYLLKISAVLTHHSIPCVFQEIRNMHNEQLMGIRREEEMEMSDDDMEDVPDSKDSEDSGMHMHIIFTVQHFCQHAKLIH